VSVNQKFVYAAVSVVATLVGAVLVRRCGAAIQLCGMEVALVYSGLNEREVMEKLVNTDLRETCEYVCNA